MSKPKVLPKNPVARQKFFSQHFLWHTSVEKSTRFAHRVFLKSERFLESINAYSHSPYVPLQLWFDYLKDHAVSRGFFLPYQPLRMPDDLYDPFMYYWPPLAVDHSDSFSDIALVMNCSEHDHHQLVTIMIQHDIGESATPSMQLLKEQLERLHPLANQQPFPKKTLLIH